LRILGTKRVVSTFVSLKIAVASLADAWIEIAGTMGCFVGASVASLADAWIEITKTIEGK